MEHIDQFNSYFANRPLTISNSTDTLEGYHFNDGDKIKVQWKDGSITEEIVFCEVKDVIIPAVGNFAVGSDAKAYIDVNYKGNTIKVYLRNLDVLCERIE